MDNERHAASRRDERAKREDVILNRILVWFGAAVVAELILLWLGRYYTPHITTSEIIMMALHLHQFFSVFVWVALALAVVSTLWLAAAKRGGKRTRLPLIGTVLFWVTFAMSAVIVLFGDTGIQLLCRLVLAVTVMALIFYLYQREFFCSTVAAGAGILGLWVLRRANGAHPVVVYGYLAALAVLLVLGVVLCRMLQSSGGVWKRKSGGVRVFSKNAGYWMIYLTCGLTAAAVIAGLLAGAAAAYYLMFALVAWIFAMAVYYTVKLM